MARLPTVGGDYGNWGTVLNEYLGTAHNADGTLKLDVQTIADLKAIDVATLTDKQQALVAGYYAPGDGGGGQFYYDAGASTADNGGTILAPTAGAGRWMRLYSGTAVNVRWFGAKGDGATNDTPAFQATCTAFSHVVVPDGTYRLVTGVTLNAAFANVSITGPGKIDFLPSSFPLSASVFAITYNNPAGSVSIRGLSFDGAAAGTHYDDPAYMAALQLTASSVSVTGCRITEWYGTGMIVRAGTVDITQNRLYKCCGYNLTTDLPSGLRDNYGDGIHLYAPSGANYVTAGIVSANSIWTDPETNRGRCGITLEGGNTRDVSVIGNYVHGYDRGIHVEAPAGCVVAGNRVSGAHAPVLVYNSKNTSVVNNTLVADSTTATNGWKYGVYVLGSSAGTRVEGNVIRGITCNALTMYWQDDYVVRNNTIYGDVEFTGGSNVNGCKIESNSFRRLDGLTDSGIVEIGGSMNVNSASICDNTFYDMALRVTQHICPVISRNVFKNATIDDYLLRVISSYDAAVNDSVFYLVAAATKAPIELYGVKGSGEMSGNLVYCDTDVQLLRYYASGDKNHNGVFVRRPNAQVYPSGARRVLTFSSYLGSSSKVGAPVFGEGTAIPGGYYTRSQMVWNDAASASGVVAQVCVTAGWSAPAWAGGTFYTRGVYATNDGGKVYICTTSGTSAASGGPTGTGSSIADGTGVWAYVASSAAAVFKTAITASA